MDDIVKNNKPIVASDIYDKDYFLYAYKGNTEQYLNSLKTLPIPLQICFNLAQPKEGEAVLDIGCGRGHLSYACALKGCKVTAIDYSHDAVDIAIKTMQSLPQNLQVNVKVSKIDIVGINVNEKYDIIFMADVVEHLYQWQLEKLFDICSKILNRPNGRIIIHTAPNALWISFIYPLKRILAFATTIRKKNNFFYKRDKYFYSRDMHVNEQTPGRLKKLLKSKGFNVKVWCDDGSSNVISLLTKKFCGSDIWAVARL